MSDRTETHTHTRYTKRTSRSSRNKTWSMVGQTSTHCRWWCYDNVSIRTFSLWWSCMELLVGRCCTSNVHTLTRTRPILFETQVQDAERGEIVAEVSASSAETPPLEELKWVRRSAQITIMSHTHSYHNTGMSRWRSYPCISRIWWWDQSSTYERNKNWRHWTHEIEIS